MMDDLARFTRVFDGTPLQGLGVVAIDIPGGGQAFEMDFPEGHDTSDVHANFALWHAARPFVDSTGRFPVLSFNEGEDAFSREEYDGESPASIVNAAAGIDTDVVMDTTYRNSDDSTDAWAFALADTARIVGAAPNPDELRALNSTDRRVTEGFLMRWEEERAPGKASGHLNVAGRIAPTADDGYGCIEWLPTTAPEEAAGYISYYGASSSAQRQAEFVAFLGRWRRRFGAEVVAVSGITLDLWIATPPQDLETAFEFACELDPFNKTDDSLGEFARSLVGRHEVALYERP